MNRASTGTVVGSVFGAFILLVVFGGAIAYICRRTRKSETTLAPVPS